MSQFVALRARLIEEMQRIHGRTYPVVWRDDMVSCAWTAQIDFPPSMAVPMDLAAATGPQSSGECCLRRLVERYARYTGTIVE